MNTQRALFVSGMVLGVGLGLMLSHFLRQTPPTTTVQASLPLDLQARSFQSTFLEDQFITAPLTDSPYFLSDEDIVEGSLQDPPPLRNALAVDTAPAPASPRQNQLVPVSQPGLVPEPQPLPLSEATPLTQNSAKDQATIRGIIELELNHLSEEKRQVWFEALKDVNKEDVAGILKMWKLLGGPIPESPMGLPSTPDLKSSPDTKAPVSTKQKTNSDVSNLIDQAEEVLQRNALMRNTPGYVPQVPCIVESPEGELTLSVRDDFEAYRHVTTGFPLDLAIEGPGFFQVVDEEGERFLTRQGRFSLNAESQVILRIGEQSLKLSPDLVLPEAEEPGSTLRIDPTGSVALVRKQDQKISVVAQVGRIEIVQPLAQDSLVSVGHGLFRLETDYAEHRNVVLLDEQWGTHLAPGHLELPGFVDGSVQKHLTQLRELFTK